MAFPAKKYNKWHSQLKKYNIWHSQLKKLQQMASMHLFKLKKRIDELVVNEYVFQIARAQSPASHIITSLSFIWLANFG